MRALWPWLLVVPLAALAAPPVARAVEREEVVATQLLPRAPNAGVVCAAAVDALSRRLEAAIADLRIAAQRTDGAFCGRDRIRRRIPGGTCSPRVLLVL